MLSRKLLNCDRRAFVVDLYFCTAKLPGTSLRNMPKAKQADVKLRHVRYREKMGSNLPVPSTIDVQVIGSGARGSPRSVLFGTGHAKYLFNCGEGTQRIAFEHKMKLSRVENIFITHKSWENIGGLLGMALTLDGCSVPTLTIHGPPGVEKLTHMMRAFGDKDSHYFGKLEKKELGDGPFKDHAFVFEYVPLYRNTATCSGDSTVEKVQSQSTGKPRRSSETSDVVFAYICRPNPTPRRVNLEKCVQVGIKPGPIIGLLTSGKSVTLDDGREVHPDQILDPQEASKPILVVECPDEDFLASLLASNPVQELISENTVDLVVHMSPEHILANPGYQNWMESFGDETRHLLLNTATPEVSQINPYLIQSKLNLLHPSIFPVLPHLRTPPPRPEADADSRVVKGCTNLIYQYRPRRGFTWNQCIKLNPEEFVEEAMNMEGFPEALDSLKSQLQALPEGGEDKHYPAVTFLGTGSSIPSKDRNVSCILLHVSDESVIVFDCGEGSSSQLYRHYGSDADSILRKIKTIFVSHMHADHHMGLFGLVNERIKAYERAGIPYPPLHLLAPIQINRWINFYTVQVEPIKDKIRFFPLQQLLLCSVEENLANHEAVLSNLNLKELRPVDVLHCRNAFGISIVHQDGWKVVYSGDTMPCQGLVQAGKDCDLLIHEASMEDDLAEDAKVKTHSTTSQAIDIGVKMEAKFILLTHFSQRYAKIPIFNDRFNDKVGIAFDNMTVSLGNLHLMPLFNDALKALFVENYNEMVAKRSKRSLRKHLLKEMKLKEENKHESDSSPTKAVKRDENVKAAL